MENNNMNEYNKLKKKYNELVLKNIIFQTSYLALSVGAPMIMYLIGKSVGALDESYESFGHFKNTVDSNGKEISIPLANEVTENINVVSFVGDWTLNEDNYYERKTINYKFSEKNLELLKKSVSTDYITEILPYINSPEEIMDYKISLNDEDINSSNKINLTYYEFKEDEVIVKYYSEEQLKEISDTLISNLSIVGIVLFGATQISNLWVFSEDNKQRKNLKEKLRNMKSRVNQKQK